MTVPSLRFLVFPSVTDSPVSAAPIPELSLNVCTPYVVQIEGIYDRFVGKVHERYGETRSEVMKWAEAWQQKLPDAAKQPWS